MLTAQGGLCAACQDFLPSDASKLHLDHNHVTQEVRAVLCGACNVSFGLMRESALKIEGLLNYARKHGAP
ncbi:endonuclease VII [Microbacterium phage Pavlo]|nr:endonuclease VII [Microbacterium phage Pavlo]